ncbi:hypothetical protein K456DRAFT_1515604 [Colletotrichum gloeosporioides 23]|nr:hypothetical protein K456DRAFT_1515604 [Colletotrichum gloeosporioides 23]
MSTFQDECTGSEAWHGSLQIRDKRSSSADPESLILAEVERLMAEYTRGIDPNLPRKSKGKTYYVVWKGRKCGIFTSWPQCMAQTSKFSGAQCMSPADVSRAQRHSADACAQSRGHMDVPRGRESPTLKSARLMCIRWTSFEPS